MTILEKLVKGFFSRVNDSNAESLFEEYMMAYADYVMESPDNYKNEKESYEDRKIPDNIILHNFSEDPRP